MSGNELAGNVVGIIGGHGWMGRALGLALLNQGLQRPRPTKRQHNNC